MKPACPPRRRDAAGRGWAVGLFHALCHRLRSIQPIYGGRETAGSAAGLLDADGAPRASLSCRPQCAFTVPTTNCLPGPRTDRRREIRHPDQGPRDWHGNRGPEMRSATSPFPPIPGSVLGLAGSQQQAGAALSAAAREGPTRLFMRRHDPAFCGSRAERVGRLAVPSLVQRCHRAKFGMIDAHRPEAEPRSGRAAPRRRRIYHRALARPLRDAH